MNLFRRFWPRSIRNEVLSLYKLGMARTENKDAKGAMEAYTSAIGQQGAPDDVKAMALYNRALLFAANGNAEKALADLRTITEMPGASYSVKLASRRRLERLHHRQDAAQRQTLQ